jgi:hypothetical protein
MTGAIEVPYNFFVHRYAALTSAAALAGRRLRLVGYPERPRSMTPDDEMLFDVYVRTRHAVVTLVREVGLRTARVLARHHADARGVPVYIRNRRTSAVETVAPAERARMT